MKKLFYFLVACLFAACSEDEVIPAGNEWGQDMVTKAAEPSGVYVEDGHLVVSGFEMLDSLESFVANMSDIEQVTWEKQLGFESAYTHFMPYFDEFDALEDDAAIAAFQQKYADVLRIVKEDGCNDVDYPFETYGRAALLSVDGKIKVGNTLWIYKADRKISIENATSDRIAAYSDAEMADLANGVYVDYYKVPMTRSGQASGYQTLIGGDQSKGDRRYKWALDLYPEVANGQHKTKLALYQQGFKRKNSRKDWRTYRVTYYCYVGMFRYGYNNYFTLPGKVQEIGKERGGRYYKIAEVNGTDFPWFKIEISSHGTSGYREAPALIREYVEWKGSGKINPIFSYD